MTTNSATPRRRRRVIAGGAVLAMVTALLLTLPTSGTAAADPTTGIVCQSNPANTFSLDARSGYISTPDGNSIYAWGLHRRPGTPSSCPGRPFVSPVVRG